MVINIANIQEASGHDVSLLVINNAVEESLAARLSPRVRLLRLNRPQGSANPLFMFRLNNIMRNLRPDVTHFHQVNLPRLFVKRWLGSRITTYHTTWSAQAAPYFKDNPFICAISNEVARDLHDKEKIIAPVVINGIETDKFRVRDISEVNYRPGNTWRLVNIGRMETNVKGQDMAIKAVKILVDSGLDVSLDLIGDGRDRPAVTEMIESLGLQDRVHVLGSRAPEWLYKHLCEYNMLIQTSRIEGFGLTVTEAMAAGVPVAVSDLPALVEVTDNGNSGVIFMADDPQSCAEIISEAMQTDLRPMVSLAAERVRREYDVAATARRYLELYNA